MNPSPIFTGQKSYDAWKTIVAFTAEKARLLDWGEISSSNGDIRFRFNDGFKWYSCRHALKGWSIFECDPLPEDTALDKVARH